MDKLLEMLGIQKLDEKQAEAVKDKLNTLIEVKAQEKLEGVLQEEKAKLLEAYEEKFEQYKEDITGKFSNFVDEILEQEMQIPEKVLEYARKGELYADLIEQFKVRLGVDEGLLDEEVKALLKEAKEEIIGLRGQLDKSISENLEVKSDAQDLAAELYIRRKSDGLTEKQKSHVLQMLEGITDREEIDSKFDFIVEAYNGNGDEDEDEDEEKKNGKNGKNGKKNGKKNGDEDEDEDEEMEESKKGKGKLLKEEDNDDDKTPSPFEMQVESYVNTLRTKKL